MKVRALSCSIYTDKNIGDCSNNGISSRFRDVYVFCPDGNVEIDLDNMPEILLILKSDISALEHSRDLFLVVIMADSAVSVVHLFGLAIQDSENILVNILFRCMIDMNKGGKTKTEKILKSP